MQSENLDRYRTSKDDFLIRLERDKPGSTKRGRIKPPASERRQWHNRKLQLQQMDINDLKDYILETEY
jgi:hypothetical protein